MKSGIIRLRNAAESAVYAHVAKPVFFRFDPEAIHDRIVGLGDRLGSVAATRMATKALFSYSSSVLAQEIRGVRFANPVGLGAGFDKNARLTRTMPSVGFGFMEVGSITARACEGNPEPRLVRLAPERSLLVNYGLRNEGVEHIAARLERRGCTIPLGTNIAPTNDEKTAKHTEAIADYLRSYRRLATVGEYTVLNLSCPNTCNDQPFADPALLRELLSEIGREPTKKLLFLKLSPDLDLKTYDRLLEVADQGGVDGIICGNLTKSWRNHVSPVPAHKKLGTGGGLGGKALQPLADQVLAHVAKQSSGRFILVGLGGVFTAEDAYRKIRLGASLVQIVTGMVYQGPQTASSINLGLERLLKRDGFANIREAVGADI